MTDTDPVIPSGHLDDVIVPKASDGFARRAGPNASRILWSTGT